MANFRPPTHPLLSTWLLNDPKCGLKEESKNQYINSKTSKILFRLYNDESSAHTCSGMRVWEWRGHKIPLWIPQTSSLPNLFSLLELPVLFLLHFAKTKLGKVVFFRCGFALSLQLMEKVSPCLATYDTTWTVKCVSACLVFYLLNKQNKLIWEGISNCQDPEN